MSTTYESAKTLINAASDAHGSGCISEELDYLGVAAKRVDQALTAAVRDARLAGMTWEAISIKLGVTKQAAQQKYGKLI